MHLYNRKTADQIQAPSSLSLLAIAGFALLAVLSGFRFSAGDFDFYITFIHHSHDPSLFRNDLLIGTLDSHPVYIWKLMGVMLHLIPVGLLVRAAFLLQTFLIAAAAFLFFRNFFGRQCGLPFFLLLLLLPVSAPAYGLYGLNPYGYFHAGAIAFGLTLVGYTLADRGRWIAGGMVAGTVFLVHPITAVYAAGFLFIRGVIELRLPGQRLRIMLGWLLLVAVALPSLVPAIQTLIRGSGASVDIEFWRSLARLRMNHGYFVSAWVPERFIQLAACFGLVLVLWRHHPAWKRLLPLMIMVAGGLVLMTMADVFTVRFLLRLQLGRCSYFLFFLVTAFAADTLTNRALWTRERPGTPIWTLAALAVLVIYGDAAIHNQPLWARMAVGVSFAGAAIFLLIRRCRPVHPALFFMLLAAGIGTATIARSMDDFRWTRAQEMADPWISFGTESAAYIPMDSVVMIPLTRREFRPYALRATFCNWKDGAPHLFCDRTLPEWWRRMQLFGVTLKTSRRELPALYHDRAIEVARAEGIRFVVFEKARAVATGPLLLENDAFGLADLCAWTPEDSLLVR